MADLLVHWRVITIEEADNISFEELERKLWERPCGRTVSTREVVTGVTSVTGLSARRAAVLQEYERKNDARNARRRDFATVQGLVHLRQQFVR